MSRQLLKYLHKHLLMILSMFWSCVYTILFKSIFISYLQGSYILLMLLYGRLGALLVYYGLHLLYITESSESPRLTQTGIT